MPFLRPPDFVCLLLIMGLAGPASAATVAHYRFETGPANAPLSSVIDSSGNGLHGTVIGSLSYSNSRPAVASAGSFSLDAVGDLNYGRVANSTLLGITSDFTVEAWFRTDTPFNSYGASGYGLIAAKLHTQTAGSFMGSWELAINHATGRLTAAIGFGGNSGVLISGTTTVTDGQWHHVALVMDRDVSGTTDALRLYLDGVLQAENLATYAAIANGTHPLFIGAGNFAGENGTFRGNFDGWIDELRLSDSALTTSQFLLVPEPSRMLLALSAACLVLGLRRRPIQAPPQQ